MAAPNVWVVRHGDAWAVRREGNKDPLGVHDTQEKAVSAGRQVAQAAKTELIVQGRDGEIREKHSYGHDPRSVEG